MLGAVYKLARSGLFIQQTSVKGTQARELKGHSCSTIQIVPQGMSQRAHTKTYVLHCALRQASHKHTLTSWSKAIITKYPSPRMSHSQLLRFITPHHAKNVKFHMMLPPCSKSTQMILKWSFQMNIPNSLASQQL